MAIYEVKEVPVIGKTIGKYFLKVENAVEYLKSIDNTEMRNIDNKTWLKERYITCDADNKAYFNSNIRRYTITECNSKEKAFKDDNNKFYIVRYHVEGKNRNIYDNTEYFKTFKRAESFIKALQENNEVTEITIDFRYFY